MREGIVKLIIKCELDEAHFAPWEEMTPEQQAFFRNQYTHCDGGGVMGSWCRGCDFCDSMVEEKD